jgi:uncharacterized protein involved in exopolysaccharide biosynthesis
MQDTMDLSALLTIWKRRKPRILIGGASIFLLVILVVAIWPSIYESSATILIEAQNIPQEMVKTTVTGFVEERLQAITQIVISRQNLQGVIDKLGLYPELRDAYTAEEIIKKMRDDISIEPIKADVVSPVSGRPSSATVAFTLAYQGKVPEKVTQTANALVSLYLEQNLKVRGEKANSAVTFLQEQAAELNAEIDRREAEIARFKDKNANLQALPELTALNMQTLDRLQREIYDKEQVLQSLSDRKISLEGQLASVEPVRYTIAGDGTRSLSQSEELKIMRNKLVEMKSTKSEKHPDVIRLQGQIQAMEQEVGQAGDYRSKAQALQAKRAQLALAEQRYSASHPEVVRLRADVEATGRELEELGRNKPSARRASEEPDNPAYIALKAQVTSTELDIRAARASLAELRMNYQDYQRRVENAPRVEQEYKALQRDYLTAQAKYQETLSRLQAAKESKGLEEGQMAEKLTIIEAPELPEKPVKPKRLLLLLAGFVLALGGGLGLGALAEAMDNTVHDQEGLAQLSGLSVLVVIPYLMTRADIAWRRKRAIIWSGSSLGAVAAVLLCVHAFYLPLDIIWLKILRKFQILM